MVLLLMGKIRGYFSLVYPIENFFRKMYGKTWKIYVTAQMYGKNLQKVQNESGIAHFSGNSHIRKNAQFRIHSVPFVTVVGHVTKINFQCVFRKISGDRHYFLLVKFRIKCIQTPVYYPCCIAIITKFDIQFLYSIYLLQENF